MNFCWSCGGRCETGLVRESERVHACSLAHAHCVLACGVDDAGQLILMACYVSSFYSNTSLFQ